MVRDLCPDLLSPTGLPSGLHLRLTHPEEADAALSLSVITAVPLFVCRKYFFSFFRLPLQNPPYRGNSFWGLAKCWLKYYILTWGENEGQDSEFKAEEWKILLDKQTVLKKAARGFEANESFWFLGKSCTLFDSTLSLNNPILKKRPLLYSFWDLNQIQRHLILERIDIAGLGLWTVMNHKWSGGRPLLKCTALVFWEVVLLCAFLCSFLCINVGYVSACGNVTNHRSRAPKCNPPKETRRAAKIWKINKT